MKFILFLALSALPVLCQTCGNLTLNPITGRLDCIGSTSIAITSIDSPDGSITITPGTTTSLVVNESMIAGAAANNDFTGANKVGLGGNGFVSITVPNEAVTGTTVNTLTSFSSAGNTAIISSAAATLGILGITVSGNGTTGNARIAVRGWAICVFDGATIAGHYVKVSASVAGDCTDAGATKPTTGQTLGTVTSTNGGAGSYTVLLTITDVATSTGTVTTVGFTGGLISVANPTTTPAFTVAGTSGGIPFFQTASTWASSAAGAANTIMVWGGAGTAPGASLVQLAAGTAIFSPTSDGATAICFDKADRTTVVMCLDTTNSYLQVSRSGTLNLQVGTNSVNGVYARILTTENSFSGYDTAGQALAVGTTGRGFYADSTRVGLRGGYVFGWSNGDGSFTFDTGISRKTSTAGWVKVGNGTANDSSGTIEATRSLIGGNGIDPSYEMQITNSASGGKTLYVGDRTATTGSTKITKECGQGQSGVLEEARAYNGTVATGTVFQSLDCSGVFTSTAFKGSDAAPTPTSCGTSPTVLSGSSSFGGTVTEGSIATGCVITMVTTPLKCNVTSQAGLVFSYALSGAVLTITNVGALSSTKLDYTCTN